MDTICCGSDRLSVIKVDGHRAVSQMNGFDLLVIMIFTTTITEPIVTKKLGVAVWYALAVTIIYQLYTLLTIKNGFKKWLNPKPHVLIQHGDINKDGLRKVKMPIETLLAELRAQGYTKTSDIELAVMEEIGKISVIPKANYRPLQPSDIQIQPPPAFIPIPLIIDGKIIYENLGYLQKGQEWLILQLQANGFNMENVKDITLATYNQNGTVLIDKIQSPKRKGTYDYLPGPDH